jgi:hypothetical protein
VSGVRPGESGICHSTDGNVALNDAIVLPAVSFLLRLNEYDPAGGTRRIGFWTAVGAGVPYSFVYHHAMKSLSAACATVIVAPALPRCEIHRGRRVTVRGQRLVERHLELRRAHGDVAVEGERALPLRPVQRVLAVSATVGSVV